MATVKEKSKEDVKEILKRKLVEAGVGKRPMTFRLCGERNNHSFRPKCKYVDRETNYGFNLRYAPIFDTPFEEDQDIDGPVDLNRVDFPGHIWTVYPDDPCLQAYLFLHPFNGKDKVFYLENKEEDAKAITSRYDDMAAVIELCKTSDIESLQAVYSMLFSNSVERNVSILRAGILDKMDEIGPRQVLDMFNDKHNKIKFHLQSALRLNVVKVNARNTELSWYAGGKIYDCAPGLNVRDEFAAWASTSDEGSKAYEKILQKLNS